MKLAVKDVARVLPTDIDPTLRCDVKELDAVIFTCVAAAKEVLTMHPPPAYNDLEWHVLLDILEGIRMLLGAPKEHGR